MVPPLTLQCWLHVCNPENRPHGLHLRWCAHDIELHVGMAPVFPEICVGLRCCLCTKYRKVLHELLWQVSLVCVLTIRNKKAFEKKKKHHLISQIVCPSTLDLDLDQLTESDIQKSSSSSCFADFICDETPLQIDLFRKGSTARISDSGKMAAQNACFREQG